MCKKKGEQDLFVQEIKQEDEEEEDEEEEEEELQKQQQQQPRFLSSKKRQHSPELGALFLPVKMQSSSFLWVLLRLLQHYIWRAILVRKVLTEESKKNLRQ